MGPYQSADSILPFSKSIVYTLPENVTTAFFDLPLATSGDGDVDWRISIVDKMVSLCTRQECQYHRPRTRITQLWGSSSDNADTKNTKSESDDSESPVGDLFPLRCQPFQCLHCLVNTRLPLYERWRNLDSKYFEATLCPSASLSAKQSLSFSTCCMRSSHAQQCDTLQKSCGDGSRDPHI